MIKTKPFPTIIPSGVKKTPKNRDVYPASSSPPRPAPDADEEGQADRETEQGPRHTRRSPADHPRRSGRGAHVDVAEPLLLSAPGMRVANGPGNRLPAPRHPGEGGRAPGGQRPGSSPRSPGRRWATASRELLTQRPGSDLLQAFGSVSGLSDELLCADHITRGGSLEGDSRGHVTSMFSVTFKGSNLERPSDTPTDSTARRAAHEAVSRKRPALSAGESPKPPTFAHPVGDFPSGRK